MVTVICFIIVGAYMLELRRQINEMSEEVSKLHKQDNQTDDCFSSINYLKEKGIPLNRIPEVFKQVEQKHFRKFISNTAPLTFSTNTFEFANITFTINNNSSQILISQF